jgi:hypothetical protein
MKSHVNHRPTKSHKYVNPATVPTKKKITIYRDDPRNTIDRLESSDVVYEIIDQEAEIQDLEQKNYFDDSFGEMFDPDSMLSEDNSEVVPTQDDLMIEDVVGFLDAPQNLAIDVTSYQLEDNSASSDGMVRWVASLVFDDVPGAAEYEYTINASES